LLSSKNGHTQPRKRYETVHRVLLEPESLLAEVVGGKELDVLMRIRDADVSPIDRTSDGARCGDAKRIGQSPGVEPEQVPGGRYRSHRADQSRRMELQHVRRELAGRLAQPALDLDALIGGFRPLFRALDPQKVNSIASSIITVFQGEGGTINDILDQTAQLTERLAESDQAVGEVITNLNTVLDTTVRHRKQFDQTIDKFELLITSLKGRAAQLADGTAHISDAAGTVADLLADNRSLLHDTVGRLETVAAPLVEQHDQLGDLLGKLPSAFNIIGRASGIYGDFFNFYVCDLAIKVNGLQPGGPVRSVKLWAQPSGRCTLQ